MRREELIGFLKNAGCFPPFISEHNDQNELHVRREAKRIFETYVPVLNKERRALLAHILEVDNKAEFYNDIYSPFYRARHVSVALTDLNILTDFGLAACCQGETKGSVMYKITKGGEQLLKGLAVMAIANVDARISQ